MLKTFLADTNIALADIDDPVKGNGYYAKYFPNVFRGIRTIGTARELSGEVNSWVNIDNCEVVLAGITDYVCEQGKEKYVALYFRVEK